ncbi:MAG: hypothetical protein J5809_08640 [Selenomonadaceae bacterium]|nr:hypothetical protein [Selenomonadaceae bacterium]
MAVQQNNAGLQSLAAEVSAKIADLNASQQNAQDGSQFSVEINTGSEGTDLTTGFEGTDLTTEVQQLQDEVSRIANNTQFNGIKLLDGDCGDNDQSTAMNLMIGKKSELDPNLIPITGMSNQALTGMSNQTAQSVSDKIREALANINATRSNLGSVQNRLEHAIKNLSITEENLSPAGLSIRDTDMAAEMAAFSRNNTLVQSGQSMLAQANQQNQGVLSILS